MTTAEMLWKPSDERIRESQMYQFMSLAAVKYGFAADWRAMHRWSVERRDQFWGEMFGFAQIQTSKPARAVCEGSGMLGTKWFPELEFNFAQHLLRFNDERIAIEADDERGRARSITYAELNEAVRRCAAGMRAAGVTRGDRVGGFMPNIPEAVIAMLAAASLGAIWSSCSPDFGIAGVFDRFGQIEPKLLVSADGYSYNGKRIDSLDRVRGIVERIPSITTTVIVPFIDETPKLDGVPNAVVWNDFLGSVASAGSTSRQVPPLPLGEAEGDQGGSPKRVRATCPADGPRLAASLDAPALVASPRVAASFPEVYESQQIDFAQLPFDHPLYIMYSSGTTGVPKCIVHGAGGTLLQHMKELMLHTDLRREDTILYFTTCGWMMWNWLVSSLGVGATVVLYEGGPAYPGPDRLWKLAERLGITVFGTSPKVIAACENADLHPGKQHDLSKLRAVLSTGSPLTVENFRWVYKEVKKDVQLASICGGTDIISCFMLGNPMLPVYAGEIQSLGLGMDVQAFDENGKPVIGKKGELVCCSPFPSQPTGFWNDPDGKKYRAAYFDYYQSRDPHQSRPRAGAVPPPRARGAPQGGRSEFANVWRHGDFVEITERGGVIVYGRSDATLNPGGVRIGTAEIYRQVESMEEIVDSVVVGKNTPDADVEICLFVVLREGLTLDAALIDKIKKCIAEGATKRHVPKHVRQVTEVPYTISGKKVEIAVTRMIHGEVVPNRDALKNPHAHDQYAGIV
jgi:acetoacetyl-CoA synthetase